METVLKSIAIYLMLVILFRIAGRRSLQQSTTFDLALLLVIGEAAAPAVVGQDASLTTAGLAITTLLGVDIALSLVKQRASRLERLIDGQPTILVVRGEMLHEQMRRARIDKADILLAAREKIGVLRLEDIGLAVLEASGTISVLPADSPGLR
jgi:uncharacterized membrane protein YcaP (DUF421 family)